MIESIEQLLIEPNRFNYFEELIKLSQQSSEITEPPTNHDTNQEINKYLNTIELFAFGDMSHYHRYNDQYITLNNQQLIKLIKLTIWDTLSKHDGGEVNYQHIIDSEYLRDGIEQLGDNYSMDMLLLEMNQESVSIVIDEQQEMIQVKEILKMRDLFDGQMYELRVLSPTDIQSIEACKNELEEWLNNVKGIGAGGKGERDEKKETESEDLRPRKRKTSDNEQS